MRDKKGALELSINAIVIIILAVVLLGLALVFIQDIFKKGAGGVLEIIDVSKLRIPPTADNPITMTDTVAIGSKEKKTLEIGFYCKETTDCANAYPTISACQYQEGGNAVNTPFITSLSTTVKSGSASGFKLVIEEKGMTTSTTASAGTQAGLYICNLEFRDKTDTANVKKPYAQKEIFIQIGT